MRSGVGGVRLRLAAMEARVLRELRAPSPQRSAAHPNASVRSLVAGLPLQAEDVHHIQGLVACWATGGRGGGGGWAVRLSTLTGHLHSRSEAGLLGAAAQTHTHTHNRARTRGNCVVGGLGKV